MRAIACVSRWGCRSFRVAREASRGVPASWWVICARVAVCGPVVASRHPGDLKNATNPRRIHLGHTHVSFELRGAEFQKTGVETQFHKILLRRHPQTPFGSAKACRARGGRERRPVE